MHQNPLKGFPGRSVIQDKYITDKISIAKFPTKNLEIVGELFFWSGSDDPTAREGAYYALKSIST